MANIYNAEYERGLEFRLSQLSDLPHSVYLLLKDMPPQAKELFLSEYSSRRRHIWIAYLLHIVPFPLSFTYAYLGKWGKQIAYWLTFGGFGFWAFANLFRIPGLVRQYNSTLSDQIIKNLIISYQSLGRGTAPPSPRSIPLKTDPANLTVTDLAEGYLFDYQAKTWKVSTVRQLDWNDGSSEKQCKVSSDLEKAFLFITLETEPTVFFTKILNIHRIEEPIEDQILNSKKPALTLTLGGEKFFREQSHEGLAFYRNEAIPIAKWVYFDAAQNQMLRIEKEGQDLTAYLGQQIRPSAILDILPGN